MMHAAHVERTVAASANVGTFGGTFVAHSGTFGHIRAYSSLQHDGGM